MSQSKVSSQLTQSIFKFALSDRSNQFVKDLLSQGNYDLVSEMIALKKFNPAEVIPKFYTTTLSLAKIKDLEAQLNFIISMNVNLKRVLEEYSSNRNMQALLPKHELADALCKSRYEPTFCASEVDILRETDLKDELLEKIQNSKKTTRTKVKIAENCHLLWVNSTSDEVKSRLARLIQDDTRELNAALRVYGDQSAPLDVEIATFLRAAKMCKTAKLSLSEVFPKLLKSQDLCEMLQNTTLSKNDIRLLLDSESSRHKTTNVRL